MYSGFKINKQLKSAPVFTSTPELELDEIPKKYKKHAKKVITKKPKKEFETQDYVITQQEIVQEELNYYSPNEVQTIVASSGSKAVDDDKKEDDRDIKKNSRRLKRLYRHLKESDLDSELILTDELVEYDAEMREKYAQIEQEMPIEDETV